MFAKRLILPVFLFMAACSSEEISQDEVWAVVEGCNGNELCTYATLAAAEYNKLAGRPPRQGIAIRSATTDGQRVSVEVNVPDRIKSDPVRAGWTADEELAEAVRKDLCSRKATRRFFELGGEFQISTYLPSGKQFSNSLIQSC